MSRHVVSLDSNTALQEQHVGGKGASLAWLRATGFPVPPGFVITTAAFDDMLAAAGIEWSSDREAWTPEALERIRQQIGAYALPDGLISQIDGAYRGLESVAVRSSMVGEDALAASFAGQLDTVLNVVGLDAVLFALKQCWASLFNWRLFQYRDQREADLPGALPATLSMAVVVQGMVDAQAAGVAFSADPITGQGHVIIEAARGLGDAVVQGLVQPDRYVVDARNALAETATVEKGSPVLHEEQILRLVDTVRGVAERRECPQDIEWAWDGADFHLLQCRPITSLVGKTVYSNRMVSEMVPGLIKPLVWDTNTTSKVHNVFRRIFTELLGDVDIDYGSMLKRIHSRPYANVTLFGQLFDRLGMPGNFFEMVARDETAQRRRPKLSLRNLGAVARVLRFAWRHSRVVDDGKAFVQQHHQDLEPYRRTLDSALEPQELLARYEELALLHGQTQWFVFIGPINMNVRNRILNRLVERRAPDVVPSDLIRGLVGLKALEPNQELQRLAAQAAALDSETRHLLAEGDDGTIRQVLPTSDDGKALLAAVDGFLERYGFLSSSGTDFAGASWAEDPTVIWRCIGRSAAHPMVRRSEDVAAIRETARRRVRSVLNPLERLVFDRLLASTVKLIDLREQVSLLMSEDAFHMRRIFLALADHLVTRGHLAERDDIFYLTYGELLQLVDGELASDLARDRVRARKVEMEQDAQIEPPDTVCGEHVPTQPRSLPSDQDYLVGIRGSSGLARGRARIVLEPSQAPPGLSQDDVLIVPFTDVGWTPLLSGVGGIVAETGGQLSHTAIVAREYGLPAVVSVKQATRLIQEGQRVTVDGDSGRVYLHG